MKFIRAIILLLIVPSLVFANDFDELVEDHIRAHHKFKESNKLIIKLKQANPDNKDEYLKLIHHCLDSFNKTFKFYKSASKELSRAIEDNHDYDDRDFNE
ncbi:MAG: hypothetical protein LLF94_05615, partial [Chlamydiales bacterium]|nr:hypothetical protein [Chlamydiales bacterium]